MTRAVLTLNAGSSSLKVALYPEAGDLPLATGLADRIGPDGHLRLKLPDLHETPRITSHAVAMEAVIDALTLRWPDLDLVAVGHRVVHGGLRETHAPITPDLLTELEALSPFAPLHQPHNLAGIQAAMQAFPGVPQVACFDTAFHRTHPWEADTFALPRRFYDQGVRRYGFHGLSYDYVSSVLPADLTRVVVAHLGNGASMCAIRDGRSIASTMGFSALDGLPMGTRSGQLDPGVLLYLMEQQAMSPAEISDLLYKQSGLLGLSGISNDMRVLEASDAKEAAQAIGYFTLRCAREVAGLAAAMGGVDGLVFCGGIGENSARVRRQICAGLGWMGITLDEARNLAHGPEIGAGGVRVLVVPTNEELVIAKAARGVA